MKRKDKNGNIATVVSLDGMTEYQKSKLQYSKYIDNQIDGAYETTTEKRTTKDLLYKLSQLKPRTRNILFAYYYSHKTQKQVGEEFGLSARRIGQILREAKTKLQA